MPEPRPYFPVRCSQHGVPEQRWNMNVNLRSSLIANRTRLTGRLTRGSRVSLSTDAGGGMPPAGAGAKSTGPASLGGPANPGAAWNAPRHEA